MIRELVSRQPVWNIIIVSVVAVAVVVGLTIGISSLNSKSSEVLAAELASNSPEVQDALGGERVEVLRVDVKEDVTLVTCTSMETGEVVCVMVDLDRKEVTEVTPSVSPPDGNMPNLDGETVETTIDREIYTSGEYVTIEIANISLETITGGGVYYYVYDLEGTWVAGNGLFLAFELEPDGALPSLTWDQTDKDGEQVDSGAYIIQGQAGDYSDATLIHIV